MDEQTKLELQEVYNALDTLAGMVNDLKKAQKYSWFYEGIVQEQAIKNSQDEKLYGRGAVSVVIPELLTMKPIWARPLREDGKFRFPRKKSTVLFTYMNGNLQNPRYIPLNGFIDQGTYLFTKNKKETEKVGYTGKKYLTKAFEDEKNILIDSSDEYAFYVSEKDKEIRLEATSGYKFFITTGGGGKLTLGAEGVSDSVDLEIKTGNTGTYKITSGKDIDLTTNTGDVTVKASSGKVTVEAGDGKLIVKGNGKSLKKVLEDLIKGIKNITVGTAMGNSTTPINITEFTAVEQQISSMFDS